MVFPKPELSRDATARVCGWRSAGSETTPYKLYIQYVMRTFAMQGKILRIFASGA